MYYVQLQLRYKTFIAQVFEIHQMVKAIKILICTMQKLPISFASLGSTQLLDGLFYCLLFTVTARAIDHPNFEMIFYSELFPPSAKSTTKQRIFYFTKIRMYFYTIVNQLICRN